MDALTWSLQRTKAGWDRPLCEATFWGRYEVSTAVNASNVSFLHCANQYIDRVRTPCPP